MNLQGIKVPGSFFLVENPSICVVLHAVFSPYRVMFLQRYYDGCGDVSVDSDSVNVFGTPEMHVARFAQCLSAQGCSLLAWDDSLAWGNNTSLDYQLDYALGPNPDL